MGQEQQIFAECPEVRIRPTHSLMQKYINSAFFSRTEGDEVQSFGISMQEIFELLRYYITSN